VTGSASSRCTATSTSAGAFFASEKKGTAAHGRRAEVDTHRPCSTTSALQYVPEPGVHAEAVRRSSRHLLHDAPGRAADVFALLHPDFAIPGRADPRSSTARSPRCSRTRSRSMRADPDITVGSFLSGGIDSTGRGRAGQSATSPNLLTFTTGFEREGYSEIDVAAESAARSASNTW